ncbi:interferon regulatory factor 4-like isoform X1 [Pantherophis guttatus]|uniref:Interferon regulatory factor 4-like isoform X1 n=1 Tax=Pantherophis guttatus TaxID=94885 RepID=A0A6P9ARP9_PANGU|nr:interferon regulatory factor 4-like isoform X1 [Pantherophis guttatus]
MAEAPQPMRLKEWLLAQVESGRYPGLRWVDGRKTLFRIPWKHAAKQDYREREDAALFKAWAVYKGKYREGLDQADPSVWKTRLRCALNKSPDFKEVPEKSLLEASEPYKVYQVVSPEAAQEDTEKESGMDSPLQSKRPLAPAPGVDAAHGFSGKAKPSSEPDGKTQNEPGSALLPQKLKSGDLQGCQVKGFFHTWAPSQIYQLPNRAFVSPSSQFVPSKSINSDCCLHVRLYYHDVLVKEMMTSVAEGCRITYQPVVAENDDLYGPSGMEEIQFPSPDILSCKNWGPKAIWVLKKLLPHLNRGVLLWVAPEGVFMKRQCQSRVYWKGPLAPHKDQPNKLEREKTYWLLDTQQFLQELRGFLRHGKPLPQYQIHLCFGEEFPPVPNQKLHRFITAQVEPVFARNLCFHAQRYLQGSRTCPPKTPKKIIQILQQLSSSCPAPDVTADLEEKS